MNGTVGIKLKNAITGLREFLTGQSGALFALLKSGAATITPSNYSTGPVTLSTAGDGYLLSGDSNYLHIGVLTALSGPLLIAFGTSEANAEALVDGTVSSELGMVVGAGGAAGDTYIVGIPSDASITHYAIAENNGTPSGVVMVTEGV